MKRLAPRLSYANVMATVAVFIALGGASYAAFKLPKNSVGTKQLKNNAVTTAKIKNDAVTGAKVQESSLGTVPSAASAASAANALALGGQSAAQIAAASKLSCPAGMKLGAGVCIEEAQHSAQEYGLASFDCAKRGYRLPTEGELMAWEIQYLPTNTSFNWVEPEYFDKSGGESFFRANAIRAHGGASPNSETGFGNAASPEPYRCAVAPSN